jgi:hypothetical protein
MDNPTKVHQFLKSQRKKWICDDCVYKATKVDRHEVNCIGRTLALFPSEFSRISTECSQGCSNRDKECTRAV